MKSAVASVSINMPAQLSFLICTPADFVAPATALIGNAAAAASPPAYVKSFLRAISTRAGMGSLFAECRFYSSYGAAMISFSTVSVHAPGTSSRQRPSNQVPRCDVGFRLQ
jgi:hypothetical protein